MTREEIEAVLAQPKTAADLKAFARQHMGYEPTGTKAEIAKKIRNWQREEELNDDLHAAQAKWKP